MLTWYQRYTSEVRLARLIWEGTLAELDLGILYLRRHQSRQRPRLDISDSASSSVLFFLSLFPPLDLRLPIAIAAPKPLIIHRAPLRRDKKHNDPAVASQTSPLSSSCSSHGPRVVEIPHRSISQRSAARVRGHNRTREPLRRTIRSHASAMDASKRGTAAELAGRNMWSPPVPFLRPRRTRLPDRGGSRCSWGVSAIPRRRCNRPAAFAFSPRAVC